MYHSTNWCHHIVMVRMNLHVTWKTVALGSKYCIKLLCLVVVAALGGGGCPLWWWLQSCYAWWWWLPSQKLARAPNPNESKQPCSASHRASRSATMDSLAVWWCWRTCFVFRLFFWRKLLHGSFRFSRTNINQQKEKKWIEFPLVTELEFFFSCS